MFKNTTIDFPNRSFFFSRANSTDKEPYQCMRLLQRRAEYEMYADVILVRINLMYM